MKRKLIWFVVVAAVGAVLIAAACWLLAAGKEAGSPMLTCGIALLLAAAVRLTRLLSLRRDPEKRRDYEISQKDERVVFLANRARAWTFDLTVYVEAAVTLLVTFLLPRYMLVAYTLGLLLVLQLALSVAFYAAMSRRY